MTATPLIPTKVLEACKTNVAVMCNGYLTADSIDGFNFSEWGLWPHVMSFQGPLVKVKS